jgi:hypothetical protein
LAFWVGVGFAVVAFVATAVLLRPVSAAPDESRQEAGDERVAA